MKLTEVLVYVVVYFIGALFLVASSDLWLMRADGWSGSPAISWPAGISCRSCGKLSEAQADARSMVTGRVVDSYTNISTVKLFAHADREDLYASEGMEQDARHRQRLDAPDDAHDGGACTS